MADAGVAPFVLLAGDVMTDIIVVPGGPIVRGSDRRARIRSRPGGSGANQAVWLAHYGAKASLAAKVGADDRTQTEAYLEARGVRPLLSEDTGLPTGMLVTLVDTDGERSFLTDRGANLALGPADLPARLLDGAKLLLVSGYSLFEPVPRAGVLGLIAAARERGVAVGVDPASVSFLEEIGPARFLEWTAGAEFCFPNHEEAEALTGTSDWRAQLDVLCGHYRRVAIKRGEFGAVFGNRDGVRLEQGAVAVAVRDTTGAGDAFLARFIAGWLEGAGDRACLKAGVVAGSAATVFVGGQPVAGT